MLLTADLYDGMLDALGAGPAMAAGGGGQRRGPRASLDARLTIIPCPEGADGPHWPPLAVPVRDLSRGGLRFLLPRRLPLDTRFIVLLPRQEKVADWRSDGVMECAPDGDAASSTPSLRHSTTPPLPVECVVAWWQPLARDLFALGGQFVRVASGVAAPAVAPRVVLPGLVGTEHGADLIAPPPPQRAAS